jgi:hypothetical protein
MECYGVFTMNDILWDKRVIDKTKQNIFCFISMTL